MKIKTIEMFRRSPLYTWYVKSHDSDNASFICSEIWNKMFPRFKRRRKMTISVHTHAVKGSRKFMLIRSVSWLGYIEGLGLLYYQMELAVMAILASQKKTEMPVWVTFE